MLLSVMPKNVLAPDKITVMRFLSKFMALLSMVQLGDGFCF